MSDYKRRRFVTDDGRVMEWRDGLWKYDGKTYHNDFRGPLDTAEWPLRGDLIHSSDTVTSSGLKANLEELLATLKVLCGDVDGPLGPNGMAKVARIAGEAADNLGHQLRMAAFGHHEGGIVFPSPEEALEHIAEESHAATAD